MTEESKQRCVNGCVNGCGSFGNSQTQIFVFFLFHLLACIASSPSENQKQRLSLCGLGWQCETQKSASGAAHCVRLNVCGSFFLYHQIRRVDGICNDKKLLKITGKNKHNLNEFWGKGKGKRENLLHC